MKEKLSTLKEFFGMLREALIIFLFIFLFCFPTAFKAQLARMGFDKFDMGGLSMDLKSQMKETAKTGKEVADVGKQIADLKAIIDSIANQTRNSEEKNTLISLSEQAENIYSSANILDNKVKQQLVKQQFDAEKLNIDLPEEGWIYAGKQNESKTAWDPSVPLTVAGSKINFSEGEILTIIDDVYLRNDAPALSHANSKVIAVIKASEKVRYLANDYSHAVGGGWFCWLKVQRVK